MLKFVRSIIVILYCIFVLSCFAFAEAKPPSEQVQTERGSDLGIEVVDGRVSMDVQDAEIGRVLGELGRKTGIDIARDKEIQGKINLKIVNGTVEDVLKALCENRAIVYQYDSDTKSFRIIKAAGFSSGDHHREPPGHLSEPAEISLASRIKQTQDKTSRPQTSSDKKYDSRGRPLYKAGELLVRFKEGVTDKQIADLHKALGSTVLKTISAFRIQRIKLRPGLSEDDAINLYIASGLVEKVEKNALRYPNTIPDDEYFNDQWNMIKIQAPQAWDLSQGSPEIIIAVIDTGVNYLHPDLAANIWTNEVELNGEPGVDDDGNGYIDDVYGYDFADDDADPMDVVGHGTHVAGIIGAEGNNTKGVTGVCWHIKIMTLKVQADSADSMLLSAIVEAIAYAEKNGARIVNCSYGAESLSENLEEEAMISLKNAGILAVCAAGNEQHDTDLTPNYPSSYDLDNILSVTASDQNDNLASYSNYGKTTVDVMAPGDNIKSTVLASNTDASIKVTINGNPITYSGKGMELAGTTDQTGITGLIYDCGYGYPSEFPLEVQGYIALIQRGNNNGIDFYFYEKTQNAQDKGAAAVIIYNNVYDDNFTPTLGYAGDWIPVVFISNLNGTEIKSHIFDETISSTTVFNVPSDNPLSYALYSGTSMAAPHVSGLAGLILSKNHDLNYQEVIAAIFNNVDPVSLSDATPIGSGGRINALKALCSVSAPKGDLSGNNQVDLADAVIALQILSGMHSDFCSNCLKTSIDVDGDQKIGPQEVVYILQKVGENGN